MEDKGKNNAMLDAKYYTDYFPTRHKRHDGVNVFLPEHH